MKTSARRAGIIGSAALAGAAGTVRVGFARDHKILTFRFR
jgi:hypothetical protein